VQRLLLFVSILRNCDPALTIKSTAFLHFVLLALQPPLTVLRVVFLEEHEQFLLINASSTIPKRFPESRHNLTQILLGDGRECIQESLMDCLSHLFHPTSNRTVFLCDPDPFQHTVESRFHRLFRTFLQSSNSFLDQYLE